MLFDIVLVYLLLKAQGHILWKAHKQISSTFNTSNDVGVYLRNNDVGVYLRVKTKNILKMRCLTTSFYHLNAKFISLEAYAE